MKRIVLTGGPGTGKTTILSELKKREYLCLPEVSRSIISKAQKERGIQQLFLTHPEEFNEQLLNGRIAQFESCKTHLNETYIFLDRGIPDILAYNNFIDNYSDQKLHDAVNTYQYDFVFIFPPWRAIFKNDSERYESFEQAEKIHKNIYETYFKLNCDVSIVPFGNVVDRANYILNVIEYS